MENIKKVSRGIIAVGIVLMYFVGILNLIGIKLNLIDDLLVLLIILVSVITLKKKDIVSLRKILICSGVFVLIGLFGNIIFKDQNSIIAILADIVGWQKFVLCFFLIYRLFSNCKINKSIEIMTFISKTLIIVGILIYILSFFNIFTYGEDYRYGIRVLNLGVHAQYACAIYSIITSILFINKKKNLFWIIMSMLLVALTLRSKGFGFLALVFLLFNYKGQISIKHIFITIIALLVVGWSSIHFYFSNTETARYLAIETSIKIANDNFPIGTGFGTFGTITSTDQNTYSKTYERYGLDQTYGFSKLYGDFAGDGGIATILGQFGYAGVAIFAFMLLLLLKKVNIISCFKNRYDYILLLLGYVFISSTNELCFNSNLALIYSTVIALMVIYKENNDKKNKNIKTINYNNLNNLSENIKFSVIVPIYNVEKYLCECLDRIVKQSYKNLEIILVDDGSTDGCAKICDRYQEKDNRIKVIHKENAGLGMARNSGLKIATGDYLYFLDSDDFIEVDMFSKLNCVLNEKKYDYVYFGYKRVDENSSILSEHCPIITKDEYYNDSIINDFLPNLISNVPYKENMNLNLSSWTSVISKKVVDESSWKFVSERDYISEDVYSYLVLFNHIRSVKIIPDCFYNYRCNNISLSRKFREDRFRKVKELYNATVNIQKNKSVQEHLEYLILSYYIYCIKSISLSNIDVNKKIELIKEIVDDESTIKLCEKFYIKDTISRKFLIKLISFKQYKLIYLITLIKSKIKGE